MIYRIMNNQISTIQIRRNVKDSLERLKEKPNESFEEVIVKLIQEKKQSKEEFEKLMIEECKEMYEDNLRISKEWESTLMDGLDKNGKW